VNIADWQRQAKVSLQNHSSSVTLDVQLILAHVLELSTAQLLAQPERELTKNERSASNQLLRERAAGSPIAHLVGRTEFYGQTFSITPDVLVPRPETESLVEQAVKNIPQNASVIDVGTGSGAIAVALKTTRPDLRVTASDTSTDALAVAKQNVNNHKLDIKLIEADLLEDVPQTDVVVANLPYLSTSRPLDQSVRKEPRQALLSGGDGLDHYRRLFEQLVKRTTTKLLFIEAEPEQRDELITISRRAGYSLVNHQSYVLQFKRD